MSLRSAVERVVNTVADWTGISSATSKFGGLTTTAVSQASPVIEPVGTAGGVVAAGAAIYAGGAAVAAGTGSATAAGASSSSGWGSTLLLASLLNRENDPPPEILPQEPILYNGELLAGGVATPSYSAAAGTRAQQRESQSTSQDSGMSQRVLIVSGIVLSLVAAFFFVKGKI